MTRWDALSKNAVIVVTLVAAGFFGAWLRYRPHLTRSGVWTDGESTYQSAADERVRYAVWEPGSELAGEVNTSAFESRPTLAPDGQHLVFAVGRPGLDAQLWIARRSAQGWKAVRPLYELNTYADELAPAFGPDGLYFASDREGGQGQLDLWYAAYSEGEFGTPVCLPAPVNGPFADSDPAAGPAGQLSFASQRPSVGSERSPEPGAQGRRGRSAVRARWNLFEAQQLPSSWRVTELDTLNSSADERDPAYTADGRTLLFASNRARAMPSGEPRERRDFDLYRSLSERGSWLAPENLETLNTPADERGPRPLGDEFELLYTVVDAEGDSDLWSARSRELFPVASRPVGWFDALVLISLLLLALLAWLAKRWDSIDVLYKCALISLLAHLILLWWFRDVYPDEDPVQLAGQDRTFRVELASLREAADQAASRSAERGGELELARSDNSAAAAEAPERFDLSATASSAASSPQAAPSLGLPELQSTAEAGPAPLADLSPAERSATNSDPGQAFSEPIERFERQSTQTIGMQLGESAAFEQPRRVATEHASQPQRPVLEPTSVDQETPRQSALAGATLVPEPGRDDVSPTGPERQRIDLDSVPAQTAGSGATPTMRDAEAIARSSDGELARSSGDSSTEPALTARPLAARGSRQASAAGPSATSPARFASGSNAPHAADGAPLGSNPDPIERAPLSMGERRQPPSAVPPGRSASAHGPERSAPGTREARTPATPLRDAAGPARVDREPTADAGLPGSPGESGASGASGAAPALALPTPRKLTASTDRGDRGARTGRAASTPRGGSAPTRWSGAAPQSSGEAAPAPVARPLVAVASVPDNIDDGRPGRSTLEHSPYRARFGPAKQQALETHGGDAETERAVAAGLDYLARRQRPGGHWGDLQLREKYGQVAIGKTGLALLAFLGAGHLPDGSSEHTEVSRRAVEFLLASQDRATGHFGNSSAYGHGIATYALAECYALNQDAALRAPLERALAHIVDNQERRPPGDLRSGGWSYYYRDGHRFDDWPRASITSWQVMALASARLAGLDVPEHSLSAARDFLTRSFDRRSGWIRYSHDPARINSNLPTLPGSTPAAMFALALLGEDLGHESWNMLWHYVENRSPRLYYPADDNAFAKRADGNLYFWYYGTLAMFRSGGDRWQRWNVAMKDLLLGEQGRNGSWPPASLYARTYAGDTDADRVYTTAMCVLTLEVYYRYFTPLLDR